MDNAVSSYLDHVVASARPGDLEEFIEYEEFSRGAEGQSPKTIRGAVTALRRLRRYLTDNGLPTRADLVGPREIRGFMLSLQRARRLDGHPYAHPQDEGLSRHSVNCYLRAVRSSFNRWVAEGLLPASPFARVRLPRVPEKQVRPFSEEQLRALFAAIDTSAPEGFRDYAMLATYLDSLCRCSELAGATLDDVDLKGRSLRVMGKGGRERTVPLGATVQKLLWKYLHFYRPEPATPRERSFFLTRDGRKLTVNRVEAMMKRYGRRAGIEGVRCSPHTLRHTGCVMWLRNGGDLFTLQRITGHRSLEVLRRYVNLAQTDVELLHRRHSPADNLGLPVGTSRRVPGTGTGVVGRPKGRDTRSG